MTDELQERLTTLIVNSVTATATTDGVEVASGKLSQQDASTLAEVVLMYIRAKHDIVERIPSDSGATK